MRSVNVTGEYNRNTSRQKAWRYGMLSMTSAVMGMEEVKEVDGVSEILEAERAARRRVCMCGYWQRLRMAHWREVAVVSWPAARKLLIV